MRKINETYQIMYLLSIVLNTPLLCDVMGHNTPNLNDDNFDCMIEQLVAEGLIK